MKKKKRNQFGSVLLKKFQRRGVKRRSPQKSPFLREVSTPQSRSLHVLKTQRAHATTLLNSLQKKRTQKKVKTNPSQSTSEDLHLPSDTQPQLSLALSPPAPLQRVPEAQVTVLAPESSHSEPQQEYSELTTYDLIQPKDRLKQSIEGFLLDQRSEHTRKAYGKDLKRFLKFLHGRNLAHGVDSLTRTVLIAYKESLLSDGLEHTTVDRHLATLRSFFQWLVDDGILSKSPAEGVRFMNPKRLSTTIGFSDEEVKKLLSMPDLHTRTGSLHYAILMILFYCGLRRSEVCGLRTSSVSMERNQHILRLRGKGNAERIIVMISPVWSALKHYFYITQRKMTEEDILFKPIKNNRSKTTNKPLDPSMIFYIVTKYARQAGIANRVSPHSCRATAISNARDHNVPDRAIQEFAGWASPDMITRYDKRKSSIENSAAFAILYGAENRALPVSPELPVQVLASTSSQASDQQTKRPEKDVPPEREKQVALFASWGEKPQIEQGSSESPPESPPENLNPSQKAVTLEELSAENDAHLKQKIADLIQELKS